jgi:hypothetical protein
MRVATLGRQIAPWVLLALIALTLSATPLRSGFHLRAGLVCEIGAPSEQWVAGILNWGHFISYGVLVVVGSLAPRERPLARTGALVFALSAAVELEQAVFTVGHCRVRDLLPNLLAIVLAAAACWAIRRGMRPAFSRRDDERCSK